MNRNWILGSALAGAVALAGAGLQAQSSTSSSSHDSTVIVTGCLQPAGAGGATVGTSGTASSGTATAGSTGASRPSAAGATASSFMLVNAKRGGAPGGGSGVTSIAPPGSGTTESAARAGSTQPSPALAGAVDANGEPNNSDSRMYVLRGDKYPELPRHVGQEVEISGRLMPASATGTQSGSTASGSSSTAGSAGTSGPGRTPELEVTSLRMIASVCAAK